MSDDAYRLQQKMLSYESKRLFDIWMSLPPGLDKDIAEIDFKNASWAVLKHMQGRKRAKPKSGKIDPQALVVRRDR
jgi:hypothetical protein